MPGPRHHLVAAAVRSPDAVPAAVGAIRHQPLLAKELLD
jgi:hypothetical protein